MTQLAIHRESTAIALPEPRVPIAIRVAVASDLKFIDELQKKHNKMVGFLFLESLEKKINAGHVLIAEETGNTGGPPTPVPLGYCIFQDKYDKHDDCGIFYQVNIMPTKQRGLIGAALVKAALDRAAYGCKLACCWCAQDLQANHFWESLGFVPLAFRTGSRKAGSKKEPRIHIFWQRRIREGDESTPYWFPSETRGGALGEARLALPIPPGTHWSDAKPAILPGMDEALKALPPAEKKPRGREKKAAPILKPPKRKVGVWFAPPAPTAAEKKAAKVKERSPRVRYKNDPKMVGAARELRDRYIDEINAPHSHMLPAANGKYDVSRQLEAAASTLHQLPPPQLLQAA